MELAGLESLFDERVKAIQSSASEDVGDLNLVQLGIVGITLLFDALVTFMIRYLLLYVMGTLAIIENDESSSASQSNGPNRKVESDSSPEHDASAAPRQPITSSIFKTMAYLRSRVGRLALFRGLGLYITFEILRAGVQVVLDVLNSQSPRFALVMQWLTEVILSSMKMAWIHKIISEPTQKSSLRRIGGYRTWWRIAPASLLTQFAARSELFGTLIDRDFGLKSVWPIWFLIVLPAQVIFVRVAASMLPADDVPIIPFDRTFGGKVMPLAQGGSGKLGLFDAWRTYSWSQLRRFAGLLLKIVVIMKLASFLLSALLAFEVVCIAWYISL